MMRRKLVNIFLVFAGSILLVILAYIFFSDKVFLQPVGTQNVGWIKDFSTSQISSTAMQYIGTSTNVYVFDGMKGFGFDFTGDGEPDFIGGNGERVIAIDGATNQQLFFIDGVGDLLYRGEGPHVVRVGNNKYVLIVGNDECEGQSFCPSWSRLRHAAIYSLSNTPQYSMGQLIASVPFIPSFTGNAPTVMWLLGDVVAEPGSSGSVYAMDRDFKYIQKYILSVSSAGLITFTSGSVLGSPGISDNIRGNGILFDELCNVDVNGQNTGNCKKFLFTLDLIDSETMQVVSSLTSTNGISMPLVQQPGNFISFNWQYTVGTHPDSSVLVNRGTTQNPIYWWYAMYDNGQIVAFKVLWNQNGFTITPQFATLSGSYELVNPSPGAESLAFGRVRNLINNDCTIQPCIINGALIFNLDGQIVANMNAGITLNQNRYYYVDPLVSAHGYTHDTRWGHEIQDHPSSSQNILAHVLPYVEAMTNQNFGTMFDFLIGSSTCSGSSMTGDGTYGGKLILSAELLILMPMEMFIRAGLSLEISAVRDI